MATPVTSTIKKTSQLYCAGLRDMCHRATDNQMGDAVAVAFSSAKINCTGTIRMRATVGTNSHSPVYGG